MKANVIARGIACAVVPLAYGTLAHAAGDISRAEPIEIVMEMGSTPDGKMYFKPDHLDLETGKAYKLVLRNVDEVKHELESHALVEKIFTRKIEVVQDGEMLAEIKGGISEVEVGPGATVEWYFVPIQTGTDMAMECAIEGHRQAGMHGTVTVR